MYPVYPPVPRSMEGCPDENFDGAVTWKGLLIRGPEGLDSASNNNIIRSCLNFKYKI